jgi:hypothetical protein
LETTTNTKKQLIVRPHDSHIGLLQGDGDSFLVLRLMFTQEALMGSGRLLLSGFSMVLGPIMRSLRGAEVS